MLPTLPGRLDPSRSDYLRVLRERAVVFDGAMGTSLQLQDLHADDFGGAQYEGCNEMLVLTAPSAVERVHRAFLDVGSEVVETDTFGAFSVVLAEYGIADRAHEINVAAARLARRVADEYSAPGSPRWVAGSIGPGTKFPTLGFEKTTGLRMNHNFIRPGGIAADLPDGWEDDVLLVCDNVSDRLGDYDELLTGQPIFRERTEGVGRITAQEALAMSATGPILRSTGIAWDLRRTMPYLAYEDVNFDVIIGTYGDNFDRYAIRINEIRESIKIVRQAVERMPGGDYRVQDKKVTPPPRARIDESMEALIHHFKVFTEGYKVPEGEVYTAIESPRGEIGCYIVSDGSSKPYRMHIRGPSFVNLQSLPVMLKGGLIADAIATTSSVDPVMGEVDR